MLRQLDSNEVLDTTIEPIDRSVIYEKLVYFYIIKNKIPTTYELFSSLHGKIPPYIDIAKFRKILVKMGFIWKKVLPTYAVVIENPEIRFERYNYLKQIQFYRSTKAEIYYIDIGSYDSNGNFRDHKLTKAFHVDVQQKDWVQKVIYALGPNGIHALEDVEDFTMDTVEEWVRDSLMPRISKPSVFVINTDEYNNRKLVETPTLDSLKSDMKLWLDTHRIAYDDKMSKYELFALAERYTQLDKVFFKIDETLKCGGHTVLRIPKCIANVRSAALLPRIANANFPKLVEVHSLKNGEDSVAITKSFFHELFVGAGGMYFDEYETYISSKETELIQMEDSVDNVFDMLMIKAGNSKLRDGNYEDSDIPSCSDSE